MDEIKMWAIDGTQATPVSEKKMTESEEQLEEILVKNPEMLIPELTLVGRQMDAAGGKLDLLGVDSDGRLVLFELKRGMLPREAVAQIIDYASDLEDKGVDGLATHIADSSGERGIDKIENFKEWHAGKATSLDALLPLRMFLVGLGVDDKTERMVDFLAKKGVDISLLTFHGFEQADGKMTLARLTQVAADDDSVSNQSQPRKRVSKAEWREQLTKRAEEGNVRPLFTDVCDMFRKEFNQLTQDPNSLGVTMYVPLRLSSNDSLSTAAVARVNPEQGQVRIVFYDRSVELCREDFRLPLNEIEYETWSSYVPIDRQDTPLDDPQPNIHLLVNSESWETHKDKLSALAQAMCAAIQKVNESDQDFSLTPANSLKR